MCTMRGGFTAALLLCAAAAAAQDAPPSADRVPPANPAPPPFEVVHDWTTADAAGIAADFEARTSLRWVDGEAEDMVLVSRIIGGDPPGAAIMPLGRQASDLARGGFLTDLTALAESQRWRDHMADPALLDACTIEGRVYCVPVTLRAGGWLALWRPAFVRSGQPAPETWSELVESEKRLRASGITPLSAPGTAELGELLAGLTLDAGGYGEWMAAHRDGNDAAVAGPAFTQGFEAFALARQLAHGSDRGLPDIAGVPGGKPAATLTSRGSWLEAGDEDHKCLAGLGLTGPLVLAGDGAFFPNLRDPKLEAAQKTLAAMLFEPEAQTALGNALGVLPARGSLNLTGLHACARRGLVALATRGSVPERDRLVSPGVGDVLDALLSEFWTDPDLTPADLQARYAEVIARGR